MQHATIDFETYSEAGFVYNKTACKWEALLNASKKGLPCVGTAVYAKHTSTRILSLAYKLPGQDVKLWTPGAHPPADLCDFITSGGLLEAWNVSFERWIWEEVATKKYWFPPVPPHRWRCAAAKSRAFALPGKLAEAGRVLKCSAQKNKEGTRLLNKFSMPRNPTIKDDRLHILPNHDDSGDAELLYKYNMDDVLAEIEISHKVPDLIPFELQFWQCDQEINHRGVQIDTLAVLNCLSIIEQAHRKYNAELPALTYLPVTEEDKQDALNAYAQKVKVPLDVIYAKYPGEIKKVIDGIDNRVTASSQIAKITKWMAKLGVKTDSLDEEHITELLKSPLLLPQIRRVLEIRQLIGSAAVKKLYAMLNQVTAQGRIHDLFIYHSARTGRAAGAGVQPQNMPRGQEGFDVEEALRVIGSGKLDTVEQAYGNATVAVSNCLRGMFIAKPGHVLIASDYSAIEAVVLAELAGESWRQEVFRTHGKIYEMSASKVTGIPFEELLAYKERTGKHHEARKLGKVAELASGYGGWLGAWKAFGADEFMSEEEIKRAILAWREASPAIVEFWGGQQRWGEGAQYFGVEGAAIQAVMYPGQTFAVRPLPKDHYAAVFFCKDNALYCILPSGRKLTYHAPRLDQSTRRPGTYELSYEGWNTNPKNGAPGWLRQSTYGGKLVENCIAEGTQVLTNSGWKNIENLDITDLVHDGIDFVSHGGKLFKSVQACIVVNGVLMTPDHKVLNNDLSWKTAWETKEPFWPEIRNVNGVAPYKIRWKKAFMALSMRMWRFTRSSWGRHIQRCKTRAHSFLRMSNQKATSGQQKNTWYEQTSCILGMALNDRPLYASHTSGMEELRSTWDNCLPSLERIFRKLLGRYEGGISVWRSIRSKEQFSRILKRKLQMGLCKSKHEQQAVKYSNIWANYCASFRTFWNKANDYFVSIRSRMAVRKAIHKTGFSKQRVYDILNCGERQRFVVRGEGNRPIIVHNCTQAVARDILAHAIVELERAGFPVVLHVHDEIVAEISEGSRTLEEFERIMSAMPSWAEGWPVVAKGGWVGKRYCK